MDPRTLVVLSILVVSFQGIINCQPPTVIETYLAYRDACREKIDNLPYPSTGKKGVPHCNRTWDGIACWEDWPAGELAHQPCPAYLFPPGLKGDNNAEATRQCMPDGSWQLFERLENGKLINITQTNWTACSLASEFSDNEAEEHFYQTLNVIRIIYKIGYSLSLVALIIAMAIFLYFRKLWVPRNILHMNFFMCLMFRAIIMFIRDAIQDQNYQAIQLSEKQLAETVNTLLSGNSTDTSVSFAGCNTVHTLLQYFSVTSYFWLLVEGVYLFSLIVSKVNSNKKTVKWFILFGWGFPWLFIIPWVIVMVYDKPYGCWNTVWETSYWIILAPVLLASCLNVIIFIILLFIIGYKLINAKGGKSIRLNCPWTMAISTMVLLPLSGVYVMVTFSILNNPYNPIGPLAEFRIAWDLIGASFQGLLVAVLYCFLSGEVRQQIRCWLVRLIHRDVVHKNRRCLSDTSAARRGQEITLATTNGSVHYKLSVAMTPPPLKNGSTEKFPPPQIFDFGEGGADQYDPPPSYDHGSADSSSPANPKEVSSCKEQGC